MRLPTRFRSAIAALFFSAAGLCASQALAAPVVAGFERFHAEKDADPAALGRLLITELNCTACHAHAKPLADGLTPNPAPYLGDAGERLKPQWILEYLKATHKTKPGARMPDGPTGVPQKDADEISLAITHYLSTLHGNKPSVVQGKPAGDGKALFNTMGCAACHAPLGAEAEVKADKATIPLPDLSEKYAHGSALAGFLLDPHKWRPGGRMPKLNLSPGEALAIAHAFGLQSGGTARIGVRGSDDDEIKKAGIAGDLVNGLTLEIYQGTWDKLPPFDSLKPAETTTAARIDPAKAEGKDNMALRFRGYIDIPRDGVYTFYTHSDDGSRLTIGRDVVVENDGIHAGTEKSGSIELKKGKHAITVEWFEAAGGEELSVHLEGPKVPRQQVPAGILYRAKSGKWVVGPDAKPAPATDAFMADASLVEKGKKLFTEVGCAACHTMKAGDKPTPMFPEPAPLAKLKGSAKGALAASTGMCPNYHLSAAQKSAISAAIDKIDQPATLTAAQRVDQTMTALNCYACHARGNKGGPEEGHRKAAFTGTYADLADEGRIPPHLGDVGRKLQKPWLTEILTKGTKVRPYMNTRMPVFAETLTKHLVDDFADADMVKIDEKYPDVSPKDAVKHGRVLVGTGGMGCVQCHVFKGEKSLGLPAMDLAYMPQRLHREWFQRYLLTPAVLRPGTRMPQFWPEGKSVRQDIMNGHTDQQIEAIWQYLSRGKDAPLPPGLARAGMMLSADTEAVMYRNFITGASPRGIGVGYPEKVNICFDANTLRLAMIWQGDFIDASKHWTDRGSGFQNPAGYNLISFAEEPPLAVLATESTPWPAALKKNNVTRAEGFQFKGYSLDKLRRPTFMYTMDTASGGQGGVSVSEFYEGVPAPNDKADSTLKRTLTIESAKPVENLYVKVAAGTIATQPDGSFKGGNALTVKIAGDAKAVVRTVAGKQELLVPVSVKNGKSTIVVEYAW